MQRAAEIFGSKPYKDERQKAKDLWLCMVAFAFNNLALKTDPVNRPEQKSEFHLKILGGNRFATASCESDCESVYKSAWVFTRESIAFLDSFGIMNIVLFTAAQAAGRIGSNGFE